MPPPTFLAFELLVYLLFFACLARAWRDGPAAIWQLAAGVLFGVLLEYATIQQLHAYHYGRFLVMLGDVPLAIGVAWGCILYSARLFSDATDLPEAARPVLDALLALNIDLSMDAIAIRLGFWTWAIDLHSQWFGVPYGNFWAWFWVIFFFSAGLRLVLAWKNPLSAWLAPFGALVIGVGGVLLTNRLIYIVIQDSYPVYVALVALLLAGALLLVLRLRPHRTAPRAPGPDLWVPASFHAYYLAAGALTGAAFQPPILFLISLAMAGVALAIHRTSRSTLPAAASGRSR